MPAAYAVARELTERHLGGRAAKLVDLLLEAGLAATPDAAVGVCRSQVGQDLAAELKALKWTCKMHKGKPRWMPPRARAEIAAY